MSFFSKATEALKETASQAVASARDWSDERSKKQADDLRSLVMTQSPESNELRFKPFPEWAVQFEPRKYKKDDREDTAIEAAVKSAQGSARRATLGRVHKNITQTIMNLMLEVSSKLFTGAEIKCRSRNDPAARVLNALDGVLLTFRFGAQGNKKRAFYHLRREAVWLLMQSINELIEQGAGGITDIEEILEEELALRKLEAKALLEKNMPLFAENVPSSIKKIDGVDEGVAQVRDFVRNFGEDKLDKVCAQVPSQVTQLLVRMKVAYKQREAEIQVSAGGDPEALRDAILGEVEGTHDKIRLKVSRFVDGLVAIINLVMGEAAEDEASDDAAATR